MKVLIIGGTGFMGTPLSTWALAQGHEVHVLHRGERVAALPEGVRGLQGERDDLPGLGDEIDRIGPDVVIDMIAMTEASTRPILEFFDGRTDRYVLASSCDVYKAYGVLVKKEEDGPVSVPVDEEAPLRTKLYPYAKEEEAGPEAYDKIPIERLVLGSSSLPGTIVRLPMVYGPDDRQHRFRDVVKRMSDARPFILLDEAYAGWRSTFGFVDNVAAAIGLAATSPNAAGEIYNVMDDTVLDMKGWTRTFGDAFPWSGEIVPLPSRQLPEHLASEFQIIDLAQDLLADASKIRQQLGYKDVVGLPDAVQRTIDYERQSLDEAEEKDFDYGAEDEVFQRFQQEKG